MQNFLSGTGAVAFLFSLGTCALGTGPLHSIEGLIWLVVAAVCFAAEGIMKLMAEPVAEARRAMEKGELLQCPACKDTVPAGATRCRHCGVALASPT